jgi:hypothetical protein
MSRNKPPIDDAARAGVRLLMSSEDMRAALGNISLSTERRLVQAGQLKPVRLTRSLKAAKYYVPENVAEVARGQDCSGLDAEDTTNVSHITRKEQPRRRRSREASR